MWHSEEYLLEILQMWMSSRVHCRSKSTFSDLHLIMWWQDHHSKRKMRWWKQCLRRWLWQCMLNREKLRLFLKLHRCLFLHSQLHQYETLWDFEDCRLRKHSRSLLHFSAFISEVLWLPWHFQVTVQQFFSWDWKWQVYKHYLRVLQLWKYRNQV